MRGSIVDARKIQDQKAIARETFVQRAAHANAEVSASPTPVDTICSPKSEREYTFESTAEDGFHEPVDTRLLPVTRVDAANLIRALKQLEVIARRQRHESRSRQRVESCSWIWLRSWQCKPKVITFRCNVVPIPICCASLCRPWRTSSSLTVLFASTAQSS